MELTLVINILLWLLQVTGDLLLTLVPIILALITPFLTKWITDWLITVVPKLKSLGVLIILVPIAAGAVTLITRFAGELGPTWYWQLLFGIGSIVVTNVWKAFRDASVETMGVGEKRLAAKRQRLGR